MKLPVSRNGRKLSFVHGALDGRWARADDLIASDRPLWLLVFPHFLTSNRHPLGRKML
jgi:hypothetical protein